MIKKIIKLKNLPLLPNLAIGSIGTHPTTVSENLRSKWSRRVREIGLKKSFLPPDRPEWERVARRVKSKGQNQIKFLLLICSIMPQIAHGEDLFERAASLRDQNKLEEACAVYRYIAHKDPTSFKANLCAGQLDTTNNELKRAYNELNQALTIKPSTPQEQHELANSLLHLGLCFFNHRRTDDALATFRQILTLSPLYGAVHHNIAFTLAEQAGMHHLALSHYEKALKRQPDLPEVHFCAAISYLATGNLVEGFTHYQWRWRRGQDRPRSFAHPLPNQWNGEPLLNKTMYLRAEQGLGDTLQFIRYAELLKKQGATVLVECQKPLLTLLAQCPYIDGAHAIGTPSPAFDYQSPLMDLPYILKTTVETIPADIPYLFADKKLINEWHTKLSDDTHYKIGICWQGDQAHGPAKFMPKKLFTQLGTIPGVSLYSLQKIDGNNDNECCITIMHTFGPDFDESHGRFMDTAAIMKNLDLVITVDTSIAHLAGGLGVPTWIVLPFPAEWRWLLERSDSPWYPTMRLFRQTTFENWQPVIEELMKEIKLLVN
jgi:tetratricopeptide (TPR) repeat protein